MGHWMITFDHAQTTGLANSQPEPHFKAHGVDCEHLYHPDSGSYVAELFQTASHWPPVAYFIAPTKTCLHANTDGCSTVAFRPIFQETRL